MIMKLLLLLAFNTLILLKNLDVGFSDEGSNVVRNADRQALMALKYQVSEDKRVVLASWNHSFPLCKWKGVTCGRKHKRVTGLDLGGFGLGGIISPSVANNRFYGNIPETIGGCLSMEELYLGGNAFDGVIPDMRNLRGLKYFNLSNNNLSGSIPEYLANISSLESLDLSGNNFEGMVPTKGVFQNSENFSVSGNEKLCGGIPDLKLRPCPQNTVSRTRRYSSNQKKVYIGVGIGVAFLLLLVLALSLLMKRKKKTGAENGNNLPSNSPLDPYERVSYEELRAATHEFSSSNLIGSGNFGSVFRGLLGPEFKVVAVKVLNLHNDLTGHVSDFGLARILDQESFINQVSSTGVRGTIGYAAPEYGMGGKPSREGDLYSFGVLLLEMFTGKRPTDELFVEDLTLRSYVESGLSEHVLDIADISVLHSEVHNKNTSTIAECLKMVFHVGIRCSEESPTNRMMMAQALAELVSIRERFFSTKRTRL